MGEYTAEHRKTKKEGKLKRTFRVYKKGGDTRSSRK